MNRRFLARCLYADLLKLRRTSLLASVVLAPYLVTLVFALFAAFDGERFLEPDRAWSWLAGSSLRLFSLIVLPVWIALTAAQLAAIEHRSRGFQHLFACGLPRAPIYWSKLFVVWLLSAAVILGQAMALVLAGWILRWLKPGLGFESAVPWSLLGGAGLTLAMASGFLVALQLWLAVVRRDAVVPIALGLVGVLTAVLLSALDASAAAFHPWAYPSRALGAILDEGKSWPWALAGVAGGLGLTGVAALDFSRREMP
ncbi:MAG: ABC transporter permease [Acidobacteriota bacterium]